MDRRDLRPPRALGRQGYPNGSEGDRISLAGRIVAVADVFDVITSARSYKDAGSAGAARDEIARCSGEQFDPRVVRAFLSISLGRLRLAMGPLSWLAQAPVLGRIPLAPGLATVASSAVAVVGSLAAGLVGGSHVPTPFGPAAQAAETRGAVVVASGGRQGGVVLPGRRGGLALRLASAAPTALALQAAGHAPTAPVVAEPAEPGALPAAPPAGQPIDTPTVKALPGPAPPAASPPVKAPPGAVVHVNDEPRFTAGADQSVREDAGAQTVAGWARAIAAGPADEAGQVVTFTVSNDDPSLFTAGGQPAVAPDGALTYTPAADASGVATVSVRAVDDGGTADGGADTSPSQSFLITVAPVNDAPGFTAGGDQAVFENAGAQTVDGWATAIVRGPADEAAQVVSLAVATSDPLLFAPGGRPAVTGSGALTYTPATGAHGVATVSVRAVDNGGTANGGADTSAAQTIVITVVNQAPVGNADAPSVLENSVGGVTFNVLTNDTDPELDALSVLSFDDSTLGNGALTDNGGGSFTYVPATHYSGSDTFSYTVSDGNGGTATAVVTITVTAVPDPPAAADAYITTQGVALVQPAPGVRANDADSTGAALVVDTTPVAGPANGTLSLAADGSFTYTPGLGFTGSDAFTYRVTSSGTGLSATAVATVTVSATFSTSLLYLGSSGPSSELWDLGTTAPAGTLLGLVPDYDGDLLPGLTIKSSNGDDTGDARRSQTWRWPLAGPLVLNGPVTLHLFSSQSGHGAAYVYLYDCTAGGATCTQIGYGTLSDNPWNGLLSWGDHLISVGTVNRTLLAGHELRLRLYAGHGDQRVAMTGGLPSSLTLTVP